MFFFFVCNFTNSRHYKTLQKNILFFLSIWMKWGVDYINSRFKLNILSFAGPLWNIHKMETATRDVLWEKGALKNVAIFPGKNLCWSLFFNEKRLQHRCFPVNIVKSKFFNFCLLLFYFLIFFYRVSKSGLQVFSFKSIPSKNCKDVYQKSTENLFLCIFVVENA